VTPSLRELDFCVMDRTATGGTSYAFKKEFDDLSLSLLCRALEQNRTVRVLKFGGNRATNAGAASVAEMLRKNTVLTHLDLTYNEIRDEGMKVLAEALRFNSNVRVFAFKGNPCNEQAIAKLVAGVLQLNKAEAGDTYATAQNMRGALPPLADDGAKLRHKLKLKQAHIDRMVDDAILRDALTSVSSSSPLTRKQAPLALAPTPHNTEKRTSM